MRMVHPPKLFGPEWTVQIPRQLSPPAVTDHHPQFPLSSTVANMRVMKSTPRWSLATTITVALVSLFALLQLHEVTGSKKDAPCTLTPVTQKFEWDKKNMSLIPVSTLYHEMMIEVHAECDYQTELLECIDDVCTCNETSSVWTADDECLLQNGQSCFTNLMCASRICASHCACADHYGLEILGLDSANSCFGSPALRILFNSFTTILVCVVTKFLSCSK